MSKVTRRGVLGGLPLLGLGGVSLAGLGLTGPAFAQAGQLQSGSVTIKPADQDDGVLDSWIDIYGRPTAKVMINGKGPFSFLVDTGATTTVIAARHVETLGATNLGNVTVIGATGTAIMPYVELAKLEVGSVSKTYLEVAVLPDASLKREDGILGGDVFAGRRVVFDIRERSVRIENNKRQGAPAGLSNMRVRNGLLAEIDGKVGNVPTRLMLDTGSKSCVANMKLSSALLMQHPLLTRINGAAIYGVTGQRVNGQFIGLPKVDMRAFTVRDASCIAADAPIFDLWELNDEPAMIVGVDLLSRLDSFSIDYGAKVFDAKLAAALVARNLVGFG